MKTGFKWVNRESCRVCATGEQFQRWTRGLDRLAADKYYSLTINRGDASWLEYIAELLDLWCAMYNPKHKPKGAFEFKD